MEMEIVRTCEACGRALTLDKKYHKIVRNETILGFTAFKERQEPKYYDAFNCKYCGCQTVIGERKREVHEAEFKDIKEDIKIESEPQDGQISSPEDDDTKDILKKIEEAGD